MLLTPNVVISNMLYYFSKDGFYIAVFLFVTEYIGKLSL